mmetsp:Transcript_29252/g.53961  ORF Transcript_29252/g.53961 Transcript_29252/m.53961 type:complete len:89 (+) Transcript_29252:148-414(+)
MNIPVTKAPHNNNQHHQNKSRLICILRFSSPISLLVISVELSLLRQATTLPTMLRLPCWIFCSPPTEEASLTSKKQCNILICFMAHGA